MYYMQVVDSEHWGEAAPSQVYGRTHFVLYQKANNENSVRPASRSDGNGRSVYDNRNRTSPSLMPCCRIRKWPSRRRSGLVTKEAKENGSCSYKGVESLLKRKEGREREIRAFFLYFGCVLLFAGHFIHAFFLHRQPLSFSPPRCSFCIGETVWFVKLETELLLNETRSLLLPLQRWREDKRRLYYIPTHKRYLITCIGRVAMQRMRQPWFATAAVPSYNNSLSFFLLDLESPFVWSTWLGMTMDGFILHLCMYAYCSLLSNPFPPFFVKS